MLDISVTDDVSNNGMAVRDRQPLNMTDMFVTEDVLNNDTP